MVSSALLILPAVVAAIPSLSTRQKPPIVGQVEYTSQCKTCPYDLCPNVNVPWGGDPVTLTCWTEGQMVGDTNLWLKTTEGCFLPEYDLVEYGDFRANLNYCGKVPLSITRQDATVRYLSECKWGHDTPSESILFYGRDFDVELTCWAEGGVVLDNPYWYKTTDNCHVSGSGLWETPDRDELDWCGPEPGPRANETKRSLDTDTPPPSSPRSLEDCDDEPLEARELSHVPAAKPKHTSLAARWLQPEVIGEEYAPCWTCPTAVKNETCGRKKRYEFNDTVVSQCLTHEWITYPNGSLDVKYWLLTTDWCYVEGWYFWVPPWDNYRFPLCSYWEGY